ncbi:MAG: hypothetical protein GWP74_17545 [Proteobacteria bacterium]|nr:hypothetical protein [Pseudomonadota bacterium]
MKKLIILVPCLIFSVYFANVITGAAGMDVFLSDIGEMLTLFVACIAFVITTLYLERAANNSAPDSRPKDQSEAHKR